MKTLRLEICTPEGISFQGDVRTVVLPAEEGLLGVLPGHEPTMALMRPGPLHYENADGSVVWLAISGGFARIDREKVVLLAETAETADAIDAARARAKADQKQGTLRQGGVDANQFAAIEASLKKELVRLKVASRGKS